MDIMDNQNNVALLGVSALLSQTWSIYKKRFWVFSGVMIIPIVVLIISTALMAGGVLVWLTAFSSKFAISGILLVPLMVLLFLIIFISQIWGQTALLYAVKDSQEKIGIKESYEKGGHKLSSYVWVAILAGVITFGGFVLLIVPGLIFSVWFSMALFVLIAEDLTGMDALLKSKEYVRGKWGGVFWRTFFIGILYVIIYYVPTLILDFFKVPFAGQVVNLISGLFLSPFIMTYLFLLYNNLKSLKGDVVLAPTKSTKIKFALVGILGILFIPVILYFIVFLGLTAKQNMNYTTNSVPNIILPPPPPKLQ